MACASDERKNERLKEKEIVIALGDRKAAPVLASVMEMKFLADSSVNAAVIPFQFIFFMLLHFGQVEEVPWQIVSRSGFLDVMGNGFDSYCPNPINYKIT